MKHMLSKSSIIALQISIVVLTLSTPLLIKSGCAKGFTKDPKTGLCHITTLADSRHAQKNTDDQNKYEELTAAAHQSFIDQFTALSAAGIVNITLAQIATISNSVIAFITNDQIAQFLPSQIAAFTPHQIPAFLPSQIAGLSIQQLNALTATQITNLIAEQIAAISPNNLPIILKATTPQQAAAFTSAQIQALPLNNLIVQLPNLTTAQIQIITPTQIVALGTSITPIIANLTVSQFASLSQAQIQTMTPTAITGQIGNITPTQIGYLLPSQLAAITQAQINNMTKLQLISLQTMLSTPANISAINNPTQVSQLLQWISNAPGKGVVTTDKKQDSSKKQSKARENLIASNQRAKKAFGIGKVGKL